MLRVTGSSVYRVWLNGEFLGYGPARGPIGWFRVDEWSMPKAKAGRNKLEIEVSAYNCRNFYYPRWPGFLQAEVVTGSRVIAATPTDFKAYDTGRIPVVSRYSFQRGFSEAYRLPHEPKALPLEVRPNVKLLERMASYPEFKVLRAYRPVAQTKVRWQADLKYRDNRFIDKVDNKKIDGYAKKDLLFNGWEAVWKWQVVSTSSLPRDVTLSAHEGAVFDAHVDRCGFFGFHVDAKKPTRLVALFDEMVEDGRVDATRALSANAVQWQLAPGAYDLEAFEPYMAAGLHIVVAEGEAEIGTPFLREYASPDATAACPTDDPQMKAIFEAARESFRANAVDVFTDCPGRERAGWLCDSYFTGRSSFLFTGSTRLEKLFLQNYLLPETFAYLPEGALPMCYPSDHADGVFIPNWNFWLVLELEDYLKRSGDRAMIDAFRPKMQAFVRLMSKCENADGLLEKLPSWVFVEWSKANELVQDVSYPSNATWAETLDVLARLYSRPDFAAKAAHIREIIRRDAWNGSWFVDNAVRQKDGSLKRGAIATEVAQYYMFLFGVATPESHPQLWQRLTDEFGPEREKKGLYPEVPAAAEFIGNYLRLEMLSRAGRGEQVLREMGGYFKRMADKTGTLWELSGRSASKNHGFASYAACWIDQHAPRVKTSPDGKNRIEYRDGQITVSREGRTLLGPQPIALELDRGEARVELVARNDGVAYRFRTDEAGEITVRNERCSLVFPSSDTELWVGYNWCDNPNDPRQDKLQHGCASVYTRTTPGTFVPDGRRIAYLPMTIRCKDGTTVLFSESDLRDYAGLHLRRDGRQTHRLDGLFGRYPVREKEWTAPRNYRRVREREDWIVKTNGRRTFPWRVFAIAPTPIALAEQCLVRDLAAPASGDFSWVKPGLATWEWWNKWHLEDVPFKPGVNTATYRAYVDFAAEYGLDWLLVDEGWKRGDDFDAIVPDFDLDAIVAYAAKRNVQVMLWTAWRALDGRQDAIFASFARRGVKGFKIDFMERDDAEVVRFMEETLRVAAKYRLCIDYHGCGKPTGLEKTYPNLIGIEGVHGLELMKLDFARADDFPAHDCQVVYTRAPLGMVDYTPGAMMNRARAVWKPDDANPASQGTRVHQMALYTLFPVPFQTLCDSPSRYRKNPECTRFLAAMPTTWDETKGLCGEIGRFAAVARRKGTDWWVGAITDGSARSLTIDTTFLGAGSWTAEIFSDASDAETNPEHWARTVRPVRVGETLRVRLAPGGGWTARFTPTADRLCAEGTLPVLKPGLPLLFPDDTQMESRTNIVRVFHPCRKDPGVALAPDRPWEGGRCSVYGSVHRLDDGTWRMWYMGGFDRILYADSRDGGRTWVKPNYPTNHVFATMHCPAVLLDRFDRDPSRRYKAMGARLFIADWGVVDRRQTGYFAMTSADGQKWSAGERVLPGWDTSSLAQDPRTGLFFCYHKVLEPLPGRDEERRFIYVSTSRDFCHWSAPVLALAPDEADDAAWIDNPQQRTDFYNMAVFAHAGGFIGFPTIFRVTSREPVGRDLKFNPDSAFVLDEGPIDVQMATSVDGLSFQRTSGRRTMIPSGVRDVQIAGVASGMPVTEGNETSLYFHGINFTHAAVVYAKTPIFFNTYRAIWRRWGFVSVGSSMNGGFVTKPLVLKTQDLRVNVAPEKDPFRGASFVRVSVLSPSGERLTEAEPVTGDETMAALRWKGNRPPVNVPVRIQVDLHAASLYALECL